MATEQTTFEEWHRAYSKEKRVFIAQRPMDDLPEAEIRKAHAEGKTPEHAARMADEHVMRNPLW